MNKQTKQLYRFGPFRFDSEERLLLRDGNEVPLAPKVAETLLLLVENAGHLIEKDEFIKRVWPATFVEEGNLNKNIFTLRKTLGQWDSEVDYIETVPRRGYRFVATVNLESETAINAQPASEQRSIPQDFSPNAASQPGNGLTSSVISNDSLEGAASGQRMRGLAFIGAGTVLLLILFISIRHKFPSQTSDSGPELKQQQLTANSVENTVWSGAISPNGKYLAYVDATGIRLKQVETGEVGTVPEPEGLQGRPVRWRIASWFPDNNAFIAVAMQAPLHSSTWVVSLVGQAPRLLRDNASAWSVSPDGRWIAFTSASTEFGLHAFVGDHEIWVMRADAEDARRIEADESSTFSRVKWSLDGSRLGYLKLHNDGTESKTSIEVQNVGGGPAVTVVSSPRLRDFLWLPTRLIYVAHEPGSIEQSCNLWQVPLALGGEPKGRTTRLTQWAGFCVDDLTATSDGKVLAFRRWFQQSSAYSTDFDIVRKHIGTLNRLTLNEGLNVPTAWSADSKSIIFWSRQNGRTGIFKQFLSQTTAIPLVSGSDDVRVPRLGPDRASIVYLRVLRQFDPSAPVQVMRVPIAGGQPEPILTAHLIDTPRCASLVNLCAIAERSADQKQIIITALDLLTGRGRELARFNSESNGFYAWDISPNGHLIALLHPLSRHIVIRPIAGKEQKHEFTIKDWQNFGSFDWAPDQKGFFTSSMTTSEAVLLHVDLHGDTHVLWEVKGATSAWAVPSPDGRRLVISAFVTNSNIWTVENF